MGKYILLVTIFVTFVSCHAGKDKTEVSHSDNNTDSIKNIPMQTDSINHKQIRNITLNVMETTKVTKEFEKLDNIEILLQCMKENMANGLSYSYTKRLDSGIDIDIDGRFNEFTYRETHPDSYFSIYKIYDPRGYIKEKGLMITHSYMSRIGTWYYYDENGNLVKETNYDRPYTFTFDDVIAFCKRERIPIAKGVDYLSKTVLMENGEPRKIEYIFYIYRSECENYSPDEEYKWIIDYYSTFDYNITTIYIDGRTGKVISRESKLMTF